MRGKRLGDIDVPALFRLWATGMAEREICRLLGIRHGSFYAIKDRLKLPPRTPAKSEDDFAESEPPTPEEIAERAAAIRRSWSPEEEERRIVGPRGRVQLRSYAFNHRTIAYSEAP
jgi:hypothetical protein